MWWSDLGGRRGLESCSSTVPISGPQQRANVSHHLIAWLRVRGAGFGDDGCGIPAAQIPRAQLGGVQGGGGVRVGGCARERGPRAPGGGQEAVLDVRGPGLVVHIAPGQNDQHVPAVGVFTRIRPPLSQSCQFEHTHRDRGAVRGGGYRWGGAVLQCRVAGQVSRLDPCVPVRVCMCGWAHRSARPSGVRSGGGGVRGIGAARPGGGLRLRPCQPPWCSWQRDSPCRSPGPWPHRRSWRPFPCWWP